MHRMWGHQRRGRWRCWFSAHRARTPGRNGGCGHPQTPTYIDRPDARASTVRSRDMRKSVTLRLDDEAYEPLRAAAKGAAGWVSVGSSRPNSSRRTCDGPPQPAARHSLASFNAYSPRR